MSKLPISVRCRKDMTGIASKSLEDSFKCLFVCLFFPFRLIYLLADVCQNYHTLTDGTRKYDYVTVNFKCDDNLNGWYRFQGAAGTKLVTECPVSMNKCDASFPTWLSEDHPTVAEGAVQRKDVCIRRDGERRNCSSYYIYELLYPRFSYTRYCSTD